MLIIIKKSKMENNNSLFKGTIVIILLALLACAGIFTYQYVHNNYQEKELVYEEEPVIISLEEAMNDFRIIRDLVQAEEVYYDLPEVIVEALFLKCGTMASVKDYVYEYNSNKPYYLSLQISKQLEKIGLIEKGVDGDKIDEVTIKTKLKQTDNNKSLPLNVKPDTIKQ